jgi:hypothetical protein
MERGAAMTLLSPGDVAKRLNLAPAAFNSLIVKGGSWRSATARAGGCTTPMKWSGLPERANSGRSAPPPHELLNGCRRSQRHAEIDQLRAEIARL